MSAKSELKRFIDQPELCISQGRKGREKILKQFNSQKFAKQLIKFF